MARPRILAALALAYMLFGALLNSVGTVILQSIATFGVSKSGASVLEAFKDLPIAITSFLVAALLPRLGLRRAMILGSAAVGLACAGMAAFPSFDAAKLLFAATGASFALVKVAVYAAIGLLAADPKAHASLTNAIEGLFMVGVLGGYWIFGAFIGEGRTWTDVYWLLAGMAAAVAALLAASRLDEAAARSDRGAGADLLAMLGLMARPLVLVFAASAFLYVLIEQSVGTWLPTFNREVLRLPAAMSVQAASLFAAALAVGRLASSVVLARVGWYPVLVGCVLAMGGLVALTLPLARTVAAPATGWLDAPPAAYLLPLVGLFLAPIYPALNSTMLSALPTREHAAMTGLLVVFSALGGTAGSLVTGALFERFGGPTAFSASLVPMAGLLAALTLFRRSLASGNHPLTRTE